MAEQDFLADEMPTSLGTLDELIDEIESNWGRLGAAIGGLSDEELCRPGAVGHWSIKDVFAHIAFWEAEGARRIDLIAGGLGETLQWPERDEEEQMNLRAVESMREVKLADVVRRMDESHQDLMDMLATFGEELLLAKLAVPAAEWLPGWTYLHYQEHASQIWGFKNAR